jgi:hypothetical protein
MADDLQVDTVQHPLLGPIKFPKDMPYDERNNLIDSEVRTRSSQPGAMQTRKGGPIVNANPQQNIPPSKVSIDRPGKYSQFSNVVDQAKQYAGGIKDIPTSIPTFGEAGNPDSVLGSWPEKQVGESGDYRARAEDALKQGDMVGYLGHLVNSILAPTMIPQSVEGLSQTAQTNPARAAGQLTGVGLLEKVPDAMPTKVGVQRVLTIGPKLSEEAVTKRSTQLGEDVAKYGQQTQDWQSAIQEQIKQAKVAEPQAFEDAEAKHQQRVQTIQQANAESQAGFNQRQQHLDIADQHAQTIADQLPQVHQAARAEASEAYGPQPKGTLDAQELKGAIEDTASSKLQGSTKLPAAVSKIISDIDKPPEPSLLDQASVFKGAGKNMRGGGPQSATEAISVMEPKARAKYLESLSPTERAQLETPTSTEKTAPLDASRIHGFMSELGRAARSALNNDEISSINATRKMLEGRLRTLYENEGRLSDFANGQAKWKQMANTFENTKPTATGGSPVARALATRDPVTGKLRPDYVQAILSDDKAFPVAQELLNRYQHLGAPTNELQVMKTNGDFADTLPSKVKWQDSPAGPKYPIATEWGNMPKMPKEPGVPGEIDPRQLKLERLKQISNALQSMTSRWGAMGDTAGVLGAPLTGGKSLIFPSRHLFGMALENPKLLNWLSEPSEQELANIPSSKVALKRAMSSESGSTSVPSGGGIKYEVDTNGTNWAVDPNGVRVSIPKRVVDSGEMGTYARQKLDEQVATRKNLGKK